MKCRLLSQDEQLLALQELPGWAVEGVELVKTFRFPSYLEGLAFVARLGQAAEAMDHHPDMLVGWKRVTVRLTTHRLGGLTALDVELARKADQQ